MILSSNVSFQEFQNLAAQYIPTVECVPDIAYATMSLTGEAGEVAEKVKRIFRGDAVTKEQGYDEEIVKELGDVLWCVAAICTALNTPMEYAARVSLRKMEDRRKRGLLKGSGDNR